ncbi:MAG: VanZ family protein [Solirubrobacteraceae bacterium MAG38_C4-C5]|nr:VanZ family protein [Candidatus Siliceabacter maunaloa]
MRWIPALAIMAVLFFLSAQPDLGTGWPWDLPLRKAGHMAAYGALWLALLYAVGERRPALATALALAYAVSDEWHQSFVPGRTGTVTDVAIDALGVGLAAAAWVWWRTGRNQVSPSGGRKRPPPGEEVSPFGRRKRRPPGDVTASRARSR